MIVLDASVILAYLLEEPGGEVVRTLTEEFRVSSVNVAEVVSKLSERDHTPDAIEVASAPFIGSCIAFSLEQAQQVGLWRKQTRRFGLSLGDRCCLALAKELGATVYTTDRGWADLDLGVAIKVVR